MADLHVKYDEYRKLLRLKEALERISMMGGYTKLHPDEDALQDVQFAYSEGCSRIYNEIAQFAKDALVSEG